MAYASRAGRAVVNPRHPRAFAVCDRCGIWYNHYKLRWQYEWMGTTLQNRRLLVCQICLDRPQPQLKARTIPPDPVPIKDPRPENFLAAEGPPPGPPPPLLLQDSGSFLLTDSGNFIEIE